MGDSSTPFQHIFKMGQNFSVSQGNSLFILMMMHFALLTSLPVASRNLMTLPRISAHFQKWVKIFQCHREITQRTFFKFQTFQISLKTWTAWCQHKKYFHSCRLLGISGGNPLSLRFRKVGTALLLKSLIFDSILSKQLSC